MSRITVLLVLGLGCQPKQPLQPSFYTAPKPANAPADCRETLACYATCTPLTEECMLLCDQRSCTQAVERARAVSYCSAQYGCGDQACTDERCATELQACTTRAGTPAPSPMQPQPYPGQTMR